MPSFCSTLLDQMGDKEGVTSAQEDFDVRWTANSMYSGTSHCARVPIIAYLDVYHKRASIL